MDTTTFPRLGELTSAQLTNIRSLDFMRLVSCDWKTGGAFWAAPDPAVQMFRELYPRSLNGELMTKSLQLYQKAAVAAGTTTDATWAGSLATPTALAEAFLEFVRPLTILGRVPNLRRVPFNVVVRKQTSGGTYGWVGQGAPSRLTKVDFSTETLGITKPSGIIVLTEELVRLARPGAEVTMRNEMSGGMAAFLDEQFTDPTVAAVANVSPASITNGITPITSAGASEANAKTDLTALLSAYYAANANPGVILVSPANLTTVAAAFGLQDPITTLRGNTLVVSAAMGDLIVMFDPTAILLADDNGVAFDTSREATTEMLDNPTNNSSTPTATTMVSMFQTNSVAIKAIRWINWKRTRTTAVVYVEGASYV